MRERPLLPGVLPLVCALLGGLSPARLDAQIILNAERLQPRDVSGAHLSASGSFSVAGGNSDVVDLEGGLVVGYRAGAHWVRLLSGAEYLSEDGEGLVDSRFLHLRYSRALGRRAETFHFAQVQANRSLLLERRVVVGSGVRGALLRTARSRAELGSGLMLEDERLDPERIRGAEDRRSRAWRLANVAVASHAPREGLELVGVLYLQPRVDDLADLRLLSDASLLVGLPGNVSLGLSAGWRHDTRPPAGVERWDYTLQTTLSLTLR